MAKLLFGTGEFFVIPEQVGSKVTCGKWSFGKGETSADVDLASGHRAVGRGFHLSFHRDGRVHAREGSTEYARCDAPPLAETGRATHVATIEVASLRSLPALGRPTKRRRSAKQDWVFDCPREMVRGRFPIFVSSNLADIPETKFNRFKIDGGSRTLYLGLRLMGHTTEWGPDARDLIVLGGWDSRNQDPDNPDEFVWVSVAMPSGASEAP